MITSSVGYKAQNKRNDVRIVQQLLNHKGWGLIVDGDYGSKTMQAINRYQKLQFTLKHPDGRIDPGGRTIRSLWPLAYAEPTLRGIRQRDGYGSGEYWASRDGGRRRHRGTDYTAEPGDDVWAPMSGIVKRHSKPYLSGIDSQVLSGVLIQSASQRYCTVWYIEPVDNIVGTLVTAGDTVIGKALTLKNRHHKALMTDHIHVQIQRPVTMASVDPQLFIG